MSSQQLSLIEQPSPPARLFLGDCLEVMRTLSDNSIDAIVTDPPYGISFMARKWDYDVPSEDVWRECLRLLKPGGHLLAFAGTRTQHRMAVRIEDAGFEIRDMIAWVYGSGFNKIGYIRDQDGSPIRDGWAGSIKPAMEPITMARKPLQNTLAATMQEWGTGSLNIDGCRTPVAANDPVQGGDTGKSSDGSSNVYSGGWNERPPREKQRDEKLGRWPANLIHDGSDEVLALFPQTTSGSVKPYLRTNRSGWSGQTPETSTFQRDGDTGSAARFFYCAKAHKRDRGEGNTHPTVKPHDLMRYLCRLITPPNGIVLDPFMGSGSTGKAALAEGFEFIGIEKEPEYFEIARKRVG